MTQDGCDPRQTCSKCGLVRVTPRDLVPEGPKQANGHPAGCDDPGRGLALATGGTKHPQTTPAIEVGWLRPLYDGPEQTQRRTGM